MPPGSDCIGRRIRPRLQGELSYGPVPLSGRVHSVRRADPPNPPTLKASGAKAWVGHQGTLLGIVEETQGQKAQCREINSTWPWGRRGKPLPTEAVYPFWGGLVSHEIKFT